MLIRLNKDGKKILSINEIIELEKLLDFSNLDDKIKKESVRNNATYMKTYAPWYSTWSTEKATYTCSGIHIE